MRQKPPFWFWIVSAFGLIWNLAGVAAFVHEMFLLDLGSLPEVQRLYFEERPLWATAGYATAVLGGTLGCVALLLRKEWALPMLLLCLAGIFVQIFHSIALGNAIEIFGPEGLALPFSVLLIACLLTWFAHHARRRHWID